MYSRVARINREKKGVRILMEEGYTEKKRE